MFAAKFDIVLSYEQNDDRNVRIGRIWTREICRSCVDIKGRVVRSFVILAFVLLVSSCGKVFAWSDSLRAEVSFHGGFSGNKFIHPLWSYSNQWGKFAQYEQGEFVLNPKCAYSVTLSDNLSLEAGLSLLGKSDFKESKLHEAYLKGCAYMVDFVAGLEAFTPFCKDDGIGTGAFLMSSNARPLPKVGLGFFDYKPVPFTFNLLYLKFGLYHGLMFDDEYGNFYNYPKKVHLHEKFLYGKLNLPYVKPSFGLTHSALLGGVSRNGVEIPIDYWATFFAKGSSRIGDAGFKGEQTNVAGAHQGLWHYGVELDFDNVGAELYYNRPFSGRSGISPVSVRNRDHQAGVILNLKGCKLVKRINLEYFKTDYQMGRGTPDPYGENKDGEMVCVVPGDLPTDNDERMKWLLEHFERETIEEWEKRNNCSLYDDYEAVSDFFLDMWGRGYRFGGRRPYLSNGLYYQGWSADGLSTGTPLFHSAKTMQIYAKGTVIQNFMFFTNVRINAVHLGLEGEFSDIIDYRFKFTYSKNHGSLNECYKGGSYSWIPLENYYYAKAKTECYTAFFINCKLGSNILFNGVVAYDFGQLYHTFGARAGLTYFFENVR